MFLNTIEKDIKTSIVDTNSIYSNYRITFIVVGRLGKNLVISKTMPVIESGLFSHIYVFSEEAGIALEKVKYITLPAWLIRLRPKFFKKIIRLFYEPLQLIHHARRLRPAIIHGYYSIPKGLNSLIASKFSGSKCVVSLIGGKEEIERSFFIKPFSRPFILWLLRKADHITTKGRKDNKYLMEYGFSEDRISIFNGAIDVNRFKYDNEEKDIDILFAGYFDQFKGPQRALLIIHKVISELPEIKVVFIGNGPLYNEIISKTSDLGLEKKISFKGFVTDPENYLKRARILIFPSANEGLSTAMLEAMACRCVPILSDVGNQTEAAIHEYNSLVIKDYQDIAGFTGHAVKLLKDPVKWESLALNAEKTVKEKYSVSVQSRICSQFYQTLLK